MSSSSSISLNSMIQYAIFSYYFLFHRVSSQSGCYDIEAYSNPTLSFPFSSFQTNTNGIFSNQYYWNILKPTLLEYSQTSITGIFSNSYYWNILKPILLKYSQTNTTGIFSNQYYWNILKAILLECSLT